MTGIVTDVSELVQEARRSLWTELVTLNQFRHQAYEDIFVNLCVLEVMDNRIRFQNNRAGLLNGSPEAWQRFEANDSFLAHYAHQTGTKVFTFGTKLTFLLNRDVFGLPFNTEAATGTVYDRWSDRMKPILRRLQTHPAFAGLPEVQFDHSGSHEHYEFRFFIKIG